MQNIKFHDIANIFPLIHGKEFVDLKQDISDNGVYEPIVMFESQILDGRNRFRACQEVGVLPEFVEYTGDDAVSYVLSLNLHRRHLNESQRADVGAKISTLEKGQRVDRQICLSTTQAEAAEKLNISERSIKSAKKVHKDGIPELKEKLTNGGIAVSAAEEISKQNPETQDRILNKLESGEAKNTKQATRQIEQENRIAESPKITNPNINIKKGDCLTLMRDTDMVVDVVITDPPYGIDVHNTRSGSKDYSDGEDYALNLLDELCVDLLSRCKEDAHLYFFSGYSYYPQFKAILSKYFDVQDNPLIWVKENHTMCDFSQWYPNKHEYIIFCRMPDSKRKLFNCIPDVLNYKRERSSTHSAEKPTELLKLLIEQSSQPGEVVFDPFMGSGSTGVAAKELQREFIGFEMDQQWFDVAESRIA